MPTTDLKERRADSKGSSSKVRTVDDEVVLVKAEVGTVVGDAGLVALVRDWIPRTQPSRRCWKSIGPDRGSYQHTGIPRL